MEDNWLTIPVAIDALLNFKEQIKEVEQKTLSLVAYGAKGNFIMSVRIYNGTESKLAKKDRVLDWRHNETQN